MASLTYNQLFEHRLRDLIKDEIGRIMEELAFGGAVNDMSAYKERVGKISALQDCLKMCDEAAKEPEDNREG